MRLDQALAIVDAVVSHARGPVSVFVADDHGELVAAATVDSAAPDTRLNARQGVHRRAERPNVHRAARGEGARRSGELASFDPAFIFFKGGVAAFDGERRVGAVGVSGLPGDEDDALARGRSRRQA